METKIGQKEKPKFAPPSARGKQPQAKETSEAKDAEEEKKEVQIHKEMNEKITLDMEEREYGIHPLEGVDVKKAKTVNEKYSPLAGLGKKDTGDKAVEKKGHGDQAGGMVKCTASQFLSEANDEAGREGAEKKEKKEKKLKNKKQVRNTEEDEDADGKTKKKIYVLETGGSATAQKDSNEKTKKEKTKPMLKIKEKKAPVALTDTQYDDLFDSVMAAVQLETCMEDAKAMLTEVELLQACIDQGANNDESEAEEEGRRDSCEEREEGEREVREGRRMETQGSFKDRKEQGAKSRSRQKRRREEEEEEDDSETYDSWVQCSRAACKKWRRLEPDTDPSTLPKNWTCSENTDSEHSSCDAPQESCTVCKEEEFYYCSLVPGSLVWAQQTGYPWWPAMIERDPVTGNFLEFKTKRDLFPSKCHVTYLGSPVSRAWVQRCRVREYNDLPEQAALSMVRQHGYKKKLKDAIKMAGQAEKLPLQKRLNKFGYMTRRATDGESLDEDSDIEEILGLFVESSGKGSGWRQRGKVSGDEVVKHPQKQKKKREESADEPREEGEAAREVEMKNKIEYTEETEKKEDDADKKEECEMEGKSQAEKASNGAEQDAETDGEGHETEAGEKEKEKKQPADDKKERESTKKGWVREKKGAESQDRKRKRAELPGKRKTKEMQTTRNKQDGGKTESREEEVKEQSLWPAKESDDQAVPESEDQMERGEGEGEREEGTRDEPVAGKEEVKKRPKQEERVIESLRLSDDDDDGAGFLDTDLDLMACRDDLMKNFSCAEEEEEDDFSSMVFEEE